MSGLSVDDLWDVHWTHPKAMEGASRLRQHDNFHKQLSAFRKLTATAEKRFSKDTLYQMLRVLVKGLPPLKGSKKTPREEPSHFEINSVRKLQEAVSAFQSRKRRGIQKEEEAHVVKFFSTFFKEIAKLTDYKQYFDEKIYKCLYEFFYDPTEDTNLVPAGNLLNGRRFEDSRVRDFAPSDDGDSGNYSDDFSPRSKRFTSPVGRHAQKVSRKDIEQRITLNSLNETAAKAKWSWAVRELHSTNKRWENILSKEILDPVDYEADSAKDVLHFPCTEQFVLILRLLPDIFMKSYKCVELAKVWWTQANKCLKHFPLRNTSMADFEEKSHSIRHKIHELDGLIHKGQKNLEEFLSVIKTTTCREKRAEELAADCEHLENLKTEAERKYNQALQDRRALDRKFEYAIKGTSKYFELKAKLKDHDRVVSEAYDALRMLRYQFEILHDDFLVEIEVRPSFIRFTDHVKEMVASLKETLTNMRAEKRQCEKELALIKTNFETMKNVMRDHSGVRHPDSERRGADRKGRDNTYDVIATFPSRRQGRLGKSTKLLSSGLRDMTSPLWSETEKSEATSVADGHEADTEGPATEPYVFDKYTRLLNAERKGRPLPVQNIPKTRPRHPKRASRIPIPVVNR